MYSINLWIDTSIALFPSEKMLIICHNIFKNLMSQYFKYIKNFYKKINLNFRFYKFSSEIIK